MIAIRAFFKAFKDPKNGINYLSDKPNAKEESFPAHLSLLQDLQQASRFIDFIKEDLRSLSDAQIGAAVRKIHKECGDALENLVAIRPLNEGEEGSLVEVPKNYNPLEIKIVGKVKGDPPYKGLLIHRGWKAQKRSLPKKSIPFQQDVLCPAEVEIQN